MKRKSDLPKRFESQDWGRQKRLEFIDFTLYWEGAVTIPKVSEYLRASRNTVRTDFEVYVEDLKGRMSLDRSQNRYVADDHFEPVIIEPDAEEYLYYLARQGDALDMVLNHGDRIEPASADFDFIPLLQRRRATDPSCLRALLRAVRRRHQISISYGSPNRPAAETLWIAPHAFMHDGFRWSVRAWREDYGRFGELVLDRISATAATRPLGSLRPEDDREWHTKVTVWIGPNPGLPLEGQQHIARQYGMVDSRVGIEMRQCAIVYFLKRYQIEEKSPRKLPNQEPIVVLNRDEIDQLIPERMRLRPRTAVGIDDALMKQLTADLPQHEDDRGRVETALRQRRQPR